MQELLFLFGGLGFVMYTIIKFEHILCSSTYIFCFFFSTLNPIFWQAFAPSVGQPALAVRSTTSLEACRINAKQEKRKRNRENMRKFKKGGRKGTSRKKTMRKMASSAARQVGVIYII